jgi:hypothetical protein
MSVLNAAADNPADLEAILEAMRKSSPAAAVSAQGSQVYPASRSSAAAPPLSLHSPQQGAWLGGRGDQQPGLQAGPEQQQQQQQRKLMGMDPFKQVDRWVGEVLVFLGFWSCQLRYV